MVDATEVSTMLARKSKAKEVRVRQASGIELADLRRAQSLLIGSITNRWTMQFQQPWRFQLKWMPGIQTVIRDMLQPPGGKGLGGGEATAVVYRGEEFRNRGVSAGGAGVKQFGTGGATPPPSRK